MFLTKEIMCLIVGATSWQRPIMPNAGDFPHLLTVRGTEAECEVHNRHNGRERERDYSAFIDFCTPVHWCDDCSWIPNQLASLLPPSLPLIGGRPITAHSGERSNAPQLELTILCCWNFFALNNFRKTGALCWLDRLDCRRLEASLRILVLPHGFYF